MNTIGKILVVLNLVFALVTGGFLVVDFAARNNWREEALHRKNLVQVAEASRNTAIDNWKNSLNENRKLREQIDSHLIENKAEKAKLDIRLADMKKAYDEQKARADEAIQNSGKADEEAKRLQKEVALLTDLVRKREQEIAKAQEEATNYRNQALSKSADARTALERARLLQDQIKIYMQKIAELEKGPTTVASASPRSANYSNPPPAYVKGKITKIDPVDRSLVELNIGSDVGVNKDNTLEVYRLRPTPAYLGKIRIVDAHPHMAIGRLVRTSGMSAPVLQVNDEVASSIR